MLFALKSCLVHVEAADAMAVVIMWFRGKSLLWQALPCHVLHECLEKVSHRIIEQVLQPWRRFLHALRLQILPCAC